MKKKRLTIDLEGGAVSHQKINKKMFGLKYTFLVKKIDKNLMEMRQTVVLWSLKEFKWLTLKTKKLLWQENYSNLRPYISCLNYKKNTSLL